MVLENSEIKKQLLQDKERIKEEFWRRTLRTAFLLFACVGVF